MIRVPFDSFCASWSGAGWAVVRLGVGHGDADAALGGDLVGRGRSRRRRGGSRPCRGRWSGTRSSFWPARSVPSATHDLPGVDGAADADAAAVVDAHPGGPGRGVDQRVEQRPVGDGVASRRPWPRSRGRARPRSRSPGGRGRCTIGALTLALADQFVEAHPRPGAARRSRASRSARAGPGSGPCSRASRIHRARGSFSGNRSRMASSVAAMSGRVAGQGGPPERAPCPRRTAAGCRRARSRGRRRPARTRPAAASPRMDVAVVEHLGARRPAKPTMAAHVLAPSTRRARRVKPSGSSARSARHVLEGDARWAGSRQRVVGARSGR